jgi:hypothetical protein
MKLELALPALALAVLGNAHAIMQRIKAGF